MDILWNIHESVHPALELCNPGLCESNVSRSQSELELHNTQEVKDLEASSLFLLKTKGFPLFCGYDII